MNTTASQTAKPRTPIAGAPFLAADIGGTHARLGLIRPPDGGATSMLAYREYRCGLYPGLAALIRHFLADHAEQTVTRGILACAGYVLDGVVRHEVLPWDVVISDLKQELEFQHLTLINDLEAMAYAMPLLDPDSPVLLSGAQGQHSNQPQLVIGPGTGLGSALYLPGSPLPTVLTTEAGQTALAPGNALPADIMRILLHKGHHVASEHILSGPGLLRLYQAICTLEGVVPTLDMPESVTLAATTNADPLACRALGIFCALLGSFAADLTMVYNASGGVWLAGAILPQIREFVLRSDFVARFLDKGRMRAFLETVPVRLMEHGQIGVIGAASWYLDHGQGPERGS